LGQFSGPAEGRPNLVDGHRGVETSLFALVPYRPASWRSRAPESESLDPETQNARHPDDEAVNRKWGECLGLEVPDQESDRRVGGNSAHEEPDDEGDAGCPDAIKG